MRVGPPDEVLAGTPRYRARLTSWLGGTLLAATIPIVSGRVSGKVDLDVREELSFTVPRFAAAVEGEDVVDWRPGTNPRHPLARFGQQIDATIIVESVVTSEVWETRVGRFIVSKWSDDDDGLVQVKAKGLLRIPRDDSLDAPISPTGTLMSEARRLAPAGMGVSFDPALVDRACPSTMAWSDSPLKALEEIAAAWPALLRTDVWGQIVFRAPLPDVPVPVLTFKDGEGGTLIGAPREDSRDDAFNVVIASTSNANAADVSGIAAITSGPMSINGEYKRVVKKWSSPLIETKAQADAAAQTMLMNSTRPAQSVPVKIAPDPRPELDDAVAIQRGSDTLWGWVTAYDLPLTAADGDARIDVGVPS